MTAESLIDLPPQRRQTPWATLASAGLHVLLLAVLVLLSPLRQYVLPPPAPVAVEIVTPEQFAALGQPKSAPPPVPAAPAPAPEVPAVLPAPQTATRLGPSSPPAPNLPENKTWRATKFYAAAILSEPGMDHIRKAFGSLAASEKLMQLCNIEGLEQIRRAQPQYDPDTLVSYAMSDTVTTGLTLNAAGGAFRSRRRWYGISFKCSVAADLAAVTAFEFRVGEPIPPDQWEAHNLSAEDSDE